MVLTIRNSGNITSSNVRTVCDVLHNNDDANILQSRIEAENKEVSSKSNSHIGILFTFD